jgi:hypothetical protein
MALELLVMRLHHFCMLAAASVVAISATVPARADVRIDIDKTAQKMTVSVDGTERYVWPVSTGAQGYDTPHGQYKPFRMEKDHFSREWDDAPMPNSIFFTQEGHAIHGTFETKNLGRPVSHGCVRLSRPNAATLFALVKEQGMKNTQVVLSGEIPAGTAAAVARRHSPNRDRPQVDGTERGYSYVYGIEPFDGRFTRPAYRERAPQRNYYYRAPPAFLFPFSPGW